MQSVYKIVCPYCGSLIHDMACPSCGYKVRGGEEHRKIDIPGAEAPPPAPPAPTVQPAQQVPPATCSQPAQQLNPQPVARKQYMSKKERDAIRARAVREKFARGVAHNPPAETTPVGEIAPGRAPAGSSRRVATPPKKAARKPNAIGMLAISIIVLSLIASIFSGGKSQEVAANGEPSKPPEATATPELTPPSEDAQETEQAEAKAVETYGKVVNVSQSANVRKEPSADSEKIGSAPKGSIYMIISQIDGWYEIAIDEKTGFILGDYMNVYSE